jgi:hypothetical protein
MSETGRTTDEDVLALMKELSLYGSRHPLSNESRLSMRKKIQSMIVAFGLTAIWFTVNPNDINNPVKLKLAAHRGRDGEAAADFLSALSTALQVTTLSVHDPLSSTLFFFREITLFFEHYVRPGDQHCRRRTARGEEGPSHGEPVQPEHARWTAAQHRHIADPHLQKGLALVHYICNYATKLNTRMWERLTYAEELLELGRRQRGDLDDPGTSSAMGEETKSFLLRVANRVFSSRELSQPQVLGYLLGYPTDFTNIPAWIWVHLNALYWAIVREWPGLREALSALGRELQGDNVYFEASGFKLSYLEAYRHRGPVLRDLCLYDYMCFIILRKDGSRGAFPSGRHLGPEHGSRRPVGPCPRQAHLHLRRQA